MFCISADQDIMSMCDLILIVSMKYRRQILRYHWNLPCQAEEPDFEITRSLGFTFFSAFNLVFFKSDMSNLQGLAGTEGVYISDELFIFQNLVSYLSCMFSGKIREYSQPFSYLCFAVFTSGRSIFYCRFPS